MDPYNFIKEAIVTGKYKAGERLTEESLANELSVSRTPIREAIKLLESDGLITPLKRGVTVRKFTKEDIRQIYDIRALLESYAASQAAIYRSELDIQCMLNANKKYRKTIDLHINDREHPQIDEIVRVNKIFHDSFLTASKNEYLQFHISKVAVLPLMYHSFYWYDDNQLKRSLEFHQTILQSIIDNEVERAKVAVQEHIFQGRDHVLKHLDQLEE